MGMDVYGQAPITEAGKYFRASVWSWHPLWTYACAVGSSEGLINDELARLGQFNDGAGLPGPEAKQLGELLQAGIDSGEAADEIQQRDMALDALPDETCDLCKGTGKRADMPQQDKCNACTGTGKVRPFETHYRVSLEHLQKFATFLKECGGFEIH